MSPPRHRRYDETHALFFASLPSVLSKERPPREIGLGSSLTGGQVSAQLMVPATLPTPWMSLGCWDDVPGRTISAASYSNATTMTIESCINYCGTRGFRYTGVEYSVECFCGSDLAKTALQVAAEYCNMACSGNATQPCGGPGRLNLFQNPSIPRPQTNPGVNGFVHLGCYAEGTTGRALTYGVSSAAVSSAEMTVGRCTAACLGAGYLLAGVEYGGECFCGNFISNGGTPASECNMPCIGNRSEYCGAGNRLGVYTRVQLPSAVSS